MTGFLLAVLALGLAGLDPMGVLLMVAALTQGARRGPVLLFIALSGATTVVTRVALSVLVGERLRDLLPDPSAIPDGVWVMVEMVLVLVLGIWVWKRVRYADSEPQPKRRPRGAGAVALAGAGVLFGLSAVTDPTFLAVVTLAAREPLPLVVLAHGLWFVVSQAPLVMLGAAVAAGRQQSAVTWIQALQERHRPFLRRLVTAAIALCAVLLLSDAVTYLTTGQFLLG